MWIDERGSEVLVLAECRHLLALGAKRGLVARLGVPQVGAPLVLPVDYRVDGLDPVVLIGNGLFTEVAAAGLVALEVDGIEAGQPWSVLVRGEAVEEDAAWVDAHPMHPRVAEPGHHAVRIRSDVVTARRLPVDAARPNGSPTVRTADPGARPQ